MKKVSSVIVILLTYALLAAEPPSKRPRILGIAGVRVLVTNVPQAMEFYAKLLSKDHPCLWCGQQNRNTFSVNQVQFVELAKSSVPDSNRIDEIIFATDNVPALKKYLAARNIPAVSSPFWRLDESVLPRPNTVMMEHPPDTSKEPDIFLFTHDPEGHQIGFVQLAPEVLGEFSKSQTARLIHAGFIVKDHTMEDSFYKDVLGFHLYWHGGMKDEETNWVDMQVPDGTDWIEYMLNVPPNADKHTIGVLNHIAIGVSDIEAEDFAVRKNGITAHEDPKIGRDGKWQLNFYDPDDTRIEFMEFTPKEKPCCSEFTGPHPGPNK